MTLRPDVSLISIHGKTPRIHDSAFVAPGCRIIGDVEIGPDASIWYNCVLRGDVSRIVIGARTNVQDGTVIHCDSPMPGAPDGYPTLIGDDVLIGHMAMIHGTVIEDRGFVGFAAQTMNGCVIEADGMLAAGALLAPNKRIPSRQLWSGRPATFMRELTDAALGGLQLGVQHYVVNAKHHQAALDAMADGAPQG
ncbi:gamma carbonic anhydrase family protein [Novosphingobium sp. B 225]|uniref:gamma carbonic anhydrase family protein n=1 Tax=Novosphingobium sp. B 225 TaxID=1961849 RepID=UPI000B4B3E6A|nr:gamma carbonic anhydrase family protein [Novosphingobium sp. B 225]